MRASLLVVATAFLAACGSAPKPVEPPLRRTALEVELEGARRYERGDYALAARRFEEAHRLFVAVDDSEGVARNGRHLALTKLALGTPETALALIENYPSTDIDAKVILIQALLAMGRSADAALVNVRVQCENRCPQSVSIDLLAARASLSKAPAEAAALALSVMDRLQGSGDTAELAEAGNAQRILGAARLAEHRWADALVATQAALDIDRRLAIPAKIAADWLLLGDIHWAAGRNADACSAWERALAVASAAGLSEQARAARLALSKGFR